MNAKERHPTQLQLWPDGRTVYYSGDPHGPDLRTHTGYTDTTGTEATPEDAKAIRIELRAKQYVDREILCCDSALVDKLLEESFDGFTWEEVESTRVDPSEWDLEQCKEWLEDNGHDLPDPNPWAMTREQLAEETGHDSTGEPQPSEDDMRQECIDNIDSGSIDGIDDWRDAVRDNTEEATVYQWFRVTPWFCERLREAGEVVLDNGMGCWWGRQACGQSIIMDGTLQRVAATQED